MTAMRLELSDASIAYDDAGEGEPVVFLHGSLSADWLTPVAEALRGFRRIVIHRAGYGASEDRAGGVGVPAQAGHCAAVLAECGVPRAHVVGHSAGADVALQLAYTRPGLVGSLVLLEPALPRAEDEPASTAMPQAMAAARSGDWEGAFDAFLTGVCGPDVRELLVSRLGERGLIDALASSRYFFTAESAAFSAWEFGPTQMRTVSAPTLLLVGGMGDRLGTPHRARAAHIAVHLPHAETRILEGLSHAMPLEDPTLVARIIGEFAARHPLPGRLV